MGRAGIGIAVTAIVPGAGIVGADPEDIGFVLHVYFVTPIWIERRWSTYMQKPLNYTLNVPGPKGATRSIG